MIYNSINEIEFDNSDLVAGKKIFASAWTTKLDQIESWITDEVIAKCITNTDDQTISGKKTFSNGISMGGLAKIDSVVDPEDDQDVATKKYVDDSSADGYTPASYSGGESVTLPNGLIMKFGTWTGTLGNGATKVITFGGGTPDPFPTACIMAMAVENNSTTGNGYASGFGVTHTKDNLTLFNKDDGGAKYNANWFAIGY